MQNISKPFKFFLVIMLFMFTQIVNAFDIYEYFPDFDEKSAIYVEISKKGITENYGEDGRIDEIDLMLQTAVKDDEKTATDYYILGNMFFGADLQLSIKYMKQAHILSNNNPAILYERAIQEHQNKNCEEAVDFYDSFFISEFGKTHKAAHARATDCYLRTKRYSDAVDSWIIADHRNMHIQIEKLIYSIYGGEAYYSQRNKILNKIVKDNETGLFPELIAMDLEWKRDWWNIDINQKLLDHDLELAKKLLKKNDFEQLSILVHLVKNDIDQDELLKKMKQTGLWSETSKLPESPILMYKLIFYLSKQGLVSTEQLSKRFEKELRKRVFSESKHTKNLDILAFIYFETDSDKLKEIDDLGWKKYHLAKYARSRLVHEKDEKTYTKLFNQIAKEFPYEPEIALQKLKNNKNTDKETDLMANMVIGEFPNVEKITNSYQLKGLIYSLAKQINHSLYTKTLEIKKSELLGNEDVQLASFKKNLIGIWRAESVSGDPVTGACKDMYMLYKDDGTLESHSGENISYQEYELLRIEDRWITRSKVVSSNNKPNCQGFTMEYMDNNDIADLVIDIVDG